MDGDLDSSLAGALAPGGGGADGCGSGGDVSTAGGGGISTGCGGVSTGCGGVSLTGVSGTVSLAGGGGGGGVSLAALPRSLNT